jgi:hypothetical protein
MEQVTLFMVVGGLLVLTLVVASIGQRYHDFIEERRLQVQRILNRVTEIESLIHRMTGLPVPVEIELLLRQDILARLKALQQIHPKYKGVQGLIRNAETAMGQVKARPQGPDLDALRLEQLSRLLSEIHWLLKERRLLTPVTEEQRGQFMATLELRRTDCLYRHHIREAVRLEKAQQLYQAQWHCQQLKALLEPLFQTHQQAVEWYGEMQSVCQKVQAGLRGSQSVDASSKSLPSGSDMR